jgi:hypothetical protein
MTLDPTLVNNMVRNRQARRDLAEEYAEMRQEAVNETGGNGSYETDTHTLIVKQKAGERLSPKLVKEKYTKKDLADCYVPVLRTTVTIKLKDELKAQALGAAVPGTKPVIRYE